MPVKVNHLRQGVSHSQARLHLFYICEQKPFKCTCDQLRTTWKKKARKPWVIDMQSDLQFLFSSYRTLSLLFLGPRNQIWIMRCKNERIFAAKVVRFGKKKQRHSSASASLNGRKLFRWRARLLASRLKERAKIQILQSNWIEHQLWPPPNWTYLKAV